MRSNKRVLAAVVIVLSVAAGHALGQARSTGEISPTFAPAGASPAAQPSDPRSLSDPVPDLAPAATPPGPIQPVQPDADPFERPSEPVAPRRAVQPGVPPSYGRSPAARDPLAGTGQVYYARKQPTVPMLLIPSAELKPDQLAEIREDMEIMSRILDKALGAGNQAAYVSWDASVDPFALREYTSAAATFRSLLAGPAKCMEATYLEGFGALFITRVDFPLAPVQTGKAPPKPEKESVWEQTKREMHGVKHAWGGVRATGHASPLDGRVSGPEDYDAEKVEQLQKKLLEALRHASNIRCLKAEDSVAVAVVGSQIKYPMDVPYYLPAPPSSPPPTHTAILTQPTALTIRLKKSDCDAFAQDELSFDELREKATILAY